MSQIDVIKENIQYEQLLRESSSNHVLKGEYLIRDSHPDMKEVLGVDTKANITNKEIVGDKVMVEGQLNYTVFYLPKEEVSSDSPSSKIHSVVFTEKFANYLELDNDEHKMLCEVECEVEHIEVSWMNERKVGIDGLLSLKWELYKKGDIEYVKDIEGKEDIQVLKKEEIVNGIKGKKDLELMGKTMIKVTMDKPEIDEILKCSMYLHKKEFKLGQDKVYIGCYCKIEVLYKGKETKEVVSLHEDVYLSKEEELVGASNEMISTMNLGIKNSECSVSADDLGENRVVNVEFLINGEAKVYSKEKIELLDDAYSPSMAIDLVKSNNEIGIIHGTNSMEVMVKDNMYLKDENQKIEQIICTSGSPIVIDKIVEQDKVKVEGVIKVNVLYKTSDEENCYGMINGEVPFGATIDIKNAKEGMDVIAKATLENIEATIEANTIAIRATICVTSKVCYKVNKKWVVDITEGAEGKKEKNASVIIYSIGEGDKLWDIAKKYGTTIEELMKINDMESQTELEAGNKIIIPGRAIF
ncbi:DUF3794 and LysM peptidoglycan-binding domain-containing protein [Clostridium sp.]|uniref:DUF3794 and LysM peptidoglycan-binding domain-containing protein n=1 Tax=Clostridium sp. TaxID=1506 RepID=UPI003F3701B4